MPQTAALLNDRKKALETLTKRFPALGWQICLDQVVPGPRTGHDNYRPRWRSDASGAGHPVSQKEDFEFRYKALDLALAWPSHDENTLGDLIANLQGVSEEDQRKIWDLVDNWANTKQDDSKRATLRERIRRYALTRRGNHRGLKSVIKDRARDAYTFLAPRDVVIRHQWLFTAQWVGESYDEFADENFDYQKREERIRNLRIDALREIWREKEFEGIKSLLFKSGTAPTIGWHMAEGVIDAAGAAQFLKRCLEVEDEGLLAKMDEALRGFLSKLDASVRLKTTDALLATLSPSHICRLFMCLPLQRETWLQVDSQKPEVREQYWRDVPVIWMAHDSPDINEGIDRLIEAKRPRAAFHAIQLALEEVETSRLKRLLQEVATCGFEPAGTYKLDAYHISSALNILQGRSGVAEEEMAQLELQFITVLDHSEHGIPNLERQLGKSPLLFMQALALAFKRNDNNEDPPEWHLDNVGNKEAVFTAAYTLLDKIKRIPGTDDDGAINAPALKDWVTEVRSLCLKYGRAEIGDQKIGQILSAPIVGDDGVWPCPAVRDVLEEIGSPDIALGMRIGVYNSRGVHWRGEGGAQERDLAEKYRNWARQLAFEYPYVANLVEEIAASYDHDAVREDSRAAVNKRLRY